MRVILCEIGASTQLREMLIIEKVQSLVLTLTELNWGQTAIQIIISSNIYNTVLL